MTTWATCERLASEVGWQVDDDGWFSRSASGGQRMTCRCHSGPLYASLDICPACGHRSLDRGRTWEGCERRRCDYERKLTPPTRAAQTDSPSASTEKMTP